ncbi:YTH-domain-containing protein [Metschnikowia bicuspidata var. bicuspidata NRRL YB-4993]|uniref:YTH-domain-containing protein n=1 Tax=Metschnikowia bicuspidata var. bicuspidata NRRL YB-4993 TaxID=869754 RepID=A0A1A0H276_9ASCO|nr:YTH-domain-containing protein [Metschnikowia bicuspidata var. bicuspidata NRRL YB-4993]OBA18055.1 YTH-domain-containing protein [Metschnikowia bicuspidata var. bicuspidata NRRL YB-4993]
MLLLFDSNLLVFKVPPRSRLKEPCTANTLRNLEIVTELANYTHGIDVVCTPNIWAPEYHDYFGEASRSVSETTIPTSATTPSSVSIFSSVSINSSNSQGWWPDDSDYFDLPDTAPSQPEFKRSFFRSEGKPFDVGESARFFVIKSYSSLDVQASIRNGIWASTELGNKRLDKAFRESQGGVYLFFSVNGSAKFCGVARMQSAIDFTQASDIWVESSRWKGIFPVEWLIVKEIPNRLLRHLRVYLNENKPVANSRDTQELPFDIGIAMMGTFDTYID